MKNPKRKAPTSSIRDGSNAMRRPRPVRPPSLYTPAEVDEIFRRFSVQRPEPKGELEHRNAFTLLVAVVLSAQATDVGVNKATPALFDAADTPQKMLALGEAKVGEYIRTIGLWRGKAKNVIALSQALIRDHGGEVPDDRDQLVKLPGVGRKTANVVLNMAFGQPTMAVDTHIFRIGNRLGPGAGQDAGTGRGRPGQDHPGKIHAPCASLADPARALCLQGAPTGMRALRHRRHLQGGGEDQQHTGAAGRACTCQLQEAGLTERRSSVADAARHHRRKDQDQRQEGDLALEPGADGEDLAVGHRA